MDSSEHPTQQPSPTRTRRAWSAAGIAAVAALALSGCADAAPDDDRGSSASARATAPADLPTGQVALDGDTSDVVTGLEAPWSVVRTGDDGDALVSERDSAKVLELQDDGSTREVGTVDGVSHGGEGGLLGLALHDDDLFVYSTADDGNRIQRFELTGSAGSWALGAATTIIDGLPSNTFHDGGRIAFGPDDMLYASVGDAGTSSDAQDEDSLAGKILRLTPDGDVPDDNPFDGSPVWSLGHRNVQGLGWSSDGTMFASEFGENTLDELNVIEAGENYGWPEVEGEGGAGQGFVDPVQQWSTDEASPSGLTVVDDTVFVANLRGEVLRAIPADDPGTSTEYFPGDFGRIRTVLEGPADTLWFVTNNTDGRGDPAAGDDRIVSVPLTRAAG
ncbi:MULTISPECIES: sorbosone dehydrogenase family protein [unclassified Curtobacterium]|uniref:PQQ-dependent sugar dehydrogenase n=1 Tax=unclassified Curtobacterium TaxID=257496 RepID=UPI000FA4FD99|nr:MULTISPECIES: PQQ-dependent sugar dehydrogenase [unclassified Curtobacterium]ROQ16470.1 glucose/arabinose dehydrogenase [Curtobacterium sp. PhB171]ROQ25454.1 glucose/arabinose dehydrogenase [Curtobacterium sp. PhB170]ROS36906.1 glucose/arabinose dehydrogenase [Curtobacterium sp. PhB131]ROS71582.1 glucose/arabinose dehydrogenase [Curtobacterium sp. PhB141]